MASHRIVLAGLAAVFTVGMTSFASAGGYGYAAPAPVTYAPSPCCGYTAPAPVTYSSCGGCTAPSAAMVYAQPVAPAPPPVVVGYSSGCGCGCGCTPRGIFAAPAFEPTPIAPAPIYVVNQGPEYDGPGVMVPYRTWNPQPAYADYPYVPGYGYGAPRFRFGARVAFRERFFGHPHRRFPMQLMRRHWHR